MTRQEKLLRMLMKRFPNTGCYVSCEVRTIKDYKEVEETFTVTVMLNPKPICFVYLTREQAVKKVQELVSTPQEGGDDIATISNK